MLALEARSPEGAGAFAHFGDLGWPAREFSNRGREFCVRADGKHPAAAGFLNSPGNLALGIPDKEDGTACREHRVEFAGDDESLEFRLERNQVQVRHRQTESQTVERLVGTEAYVGQTQGGHARLHPRKLGAVANEEKVNIAQVAQRRRRVEHGGKIVRPAEIPGVPDHELLAEIPFLAQRAGDGVPGRRFHLDRGPVVNDVDLVLRNPFSAQAQGHAVAQHDVGLGQLEREIAQPAQHGSDKRDTRNAEALRNFGKKILRPVDQRGAPQSSYQGARNRQERRVGLGDDDGAGIRESRKLRGRAEVEGEVVDGPRQKSAASESRRPYPVHLHAAHALARGQFARRIVVDLPAGEDLDVESSLAQVKGQIAQDLAGGGVIRMKEAIDEDQPPHGSASPRFLARGSVSQDSRNRCRRAPFRRAERFPP